ncbi:hypothetical protein [Celeribacter arenosi]|uniref:Excalibur calcium-binding domain-containing protein n=1 Tax=Celeribacter arenosi TaxID=792649 RepID=A0ABP7JTI4_9RHOB
MIRRASFVFTALVALAACETPVPDSGAGVGFGSYADYQAQREAQLIAQGEGGGDVAGSLDARAISPETASATGAPADPTGQLGDEALAAIGQAPAAVTNSVGISAENDFSAVSSERSIEQDAALVAANRQQYQVIEPTAVPARPSGTSPTLVQYALSTTNNVGQPIYSRLVVGADARAARACGKYPSPDKAQSDFLANGGPQRNAKGLDPDGDGFACSWDPRPFRLAAQARVSQ